MKEFFDSKKFSSHVRTKRGLQSLREIIGEIEGVSISTLSCIENGKIPDTETFLHLCEWLGVPPDDFMKLPPISQEPEKSTLEQILLLLRKDRTLDAELVDALAVLLHWLLGR